MPPVLPGEALLLEALPPDAAFAVERLLEGKTITREELGPILDAAERAGISPDMVAYHRKQGAGPLDLARTLLEVWWNEIPPADALTPAQRAFMHIVVLRQLRLTRFPLYNFAPWSMRRWLGLDPGGALERVVDDASKREPLWLSFARRRSDPEGLRQRLLELPMAERLEVFGELDAGGYGFLGATFPGIDALRDEGRAWAPRHADWLLTFPKEAYFVPKHADMQRVLALAWARSDTTIERRWEPLLPTALEETDVVREWIEAVPAERRAAVLGNMLKHLLWNRVFLVPRQPTFDAGDVIEALLPVFARSPPSGVMDAALVGYTAGYHAPRGAVNASVKALAKRFPVLAPALTPDPTRKPPKLTAVPAPLPNEAELSAFDREQLRELCGGLNELVEAFDLADANSDRRYRAVVHAGCDGYVVASGTTEVVAVIAQHSADGEDGVLSAAIDRALAKHLKKKARPPSAKKRKG